MIDLSQWAEFGVLAIVIGALFCVIIAGFNMFMRFIKDLQQNFKEMTIESRKQHANDVKVMDERHREERGEWAKEADRRDLRYADTTKDFTQSMRELTTVIRELKVRQK